MQWRDTRPVLALYKKGVYQSGKDRARRGGAGIRCDRLALPHRRPHQGEETRARPSAANARRARQTDRRSVLLQWCDQQCQRMDLVPSNPLSKALQYACDRESSLRMYLGDPHLPMDTNHLERTLRVIPMGWRSRLFSWDGDPPSSTVGRRKCPILPTQDPVFMPVLGSKTAYCPCWHLRSFGPDTSFIFDSVFWFKYRAGMYIKLTKCGPRRYVQLVESYRDESGRTRQRTVASLGRLEAIEENLDSLVKGLEKVSGREVTRSSAPAAEPDIRFEPSRALGDTWSLTELWHELGFDQLRQACRSGKRRIDVESLIRLMVFNRLCDPESKLGVLRWLETVCLPGIETEGIAHQHRGVERASR